MSHILITVQFTGIGFVSVILSEERILLQEVFQWSLSEKRTGNSDSTLYRQVSSVKRYADFWKQYQATTPPADLYKSSFESRIHGDPRLGWKGIQRKTSKTELEYLCKFTTWHTDKKGIIDPNPRIEQSIGWVKVLTILNEQVKSNLLAHLFASTRLGKGFGSLPRCCVGSSSSVILLSFQKSPHFQWTNPTVPSQIVGNVLEELWGRAHLSDIYERVKQQASNSQNKHINTKLRQTLQRYFTRIGTETYTGQPMAAWAEVFFLDL